MAEKDTIFSSSIKSSGIFSFQDFYNFCYDWLTEESGLRISENKYAEKLSGDSKNIDIEWTGTKDITDYFRFEVKVKFNVIGLTQVEINKNGAKIKTNKGGIKIQVQGILVKDYKGKFESSAFSKFMRDIYEKLVITSRIEQFKEKLAGTCDEFLSQTKAYLDLEGKR